ncbi:ADP-ribosylation factor 6-like [Corticium candelabrum]|uniref:ADP-ribosylation factor 6-like n=1 Tax=Corticium candelabrum TaxID=121492 RepID=UPI002E30035D|nr:ADP-ribosylation factor 6-like [Corticium candelabrum]
MGNSLRSLRKVLGRLAKGKPSRIVMVGLDSAGKTTILLRLKFDETISTIPTIGFNVETITVAGVTFNVWDVGGQDKLRPLWRHYMRSTDGLIFVVDSADKQRLDEAKIELMGLVQCEDMKSVPILIMANKQDLREAVRPEELVDCLALNELTPTNEWFLQTACALTGDGLIHGIEVMADMIEECRQSKKKKRKA